MKADLTILAVHAYSRAILIQKRLENEGIECILSNVNVIQPDASAGVRIQVRNEDLEKALKVYNKFRMEMGEKVVDEAQGDRKVNRIVVPVDFSDHSRHAATFALHYAHKTHAEILLVNAYYSPDLQTMPYDETFGIEGTLTEHLHAMREQAKKEIAAFREELRAIAKKEKAEDVLLDHLVIKGSLDDAIFYASESYEPDLIIIGARGKNLRKNDPIGSTTARILEKAKQPVLVIPQDTSVDQFFSARTVVYTTDFDESDFDAIRKLIKVVQPFGMKIICTHIGPGRDDPWEKMKMEGLKSYFTDNYPDSSVECKIIDGEDVIEALDLFISDQNVSAIAMVTHRRNLIAKLFSPSITQKMFFHTTTPLLVFHV